MLWRKTVTYTRFEKARIIGARALQLSMGAPSILAEIPKDIIDPVEIAMLEYDEGAIPITVKRKERRA
jgi:DNA-directed RNA polymerase subunit K